MLLTLYEIGGPLTQVLSKTANKPVALIPHIGIRCYGAEHFYSDHIEKRTVDMMEQLLGGCPSVTIDLGPAQISEAELHSVIAELQDEWQPSDYHVFDKNCVHFGEVLARRVCARSEGLSRHRILVTHEEL